MTTVLEDLLCSILKNCSEAFYAKIPLIKVFLRPKCSKTCLIKIYITCLKAAVHCVKVYFSH